MRLTTLLGRTLREAPAEAEQIGHQLALRAGLARALAPGSFALLPLGMAAARRIETIMHEALRRIGAQEVRTPIVQTATLWEQSGRYAAYGSQMLGLHDRAERPLVLSPTHEAALAELARREIGSYRQLPALVYTLQPAYRDEARVRGGLLGLREFTLLTACSFEADSASLDTAFARVEAPLSMSLPAVGCTAWPWRPLAGRRARASPAPIWRSRRPGRIRLPCARTAATGPPSRSPWPHDQRRRHPSRRHPWRR